MRQKSSRFRRRCGDREHAAAQYRTLAALWARADPAMQPRVHEIAARLQVPKGK